MSIFTSRVTKTITIPSTPFTATIRKLAPRQLFQAARESQRIALETVNAMGGADQLFAKHKDELMDVMRVASMKREADPLTSYDQVTLLDKGIVSWTCDEPKGLNAYEDLDEDTLRFLATEILRLSRPALFLTDDEKEEAEKNA